MTILERLVSANAELNSSKDAKNIKRQSKRIDVSIKLLLKGYCLDDDATKILDKYKGIKNVPDAKQGAEEITGNRMIELMETVYPKVPHNHFVMLIVQKFSNKTANYISNGERVDVIKSLRELANNLEKQK